MQDSHDTLQTRYRPHSWEYLIGQEHIVSILKGIVRNKAYTFTRSYIVSGCVTEDTKILVRVKRKDGFKIAVNKHKELKPDGCE